jgi:ankyrin repeat protein
MSVPASEQDEQTRSLAPSPQRVQPDDVTAINSINRDLNEYTVSRGEDQLRTQKYEVFKTLLTSLRNLRGRDGARMLLNDPRVRVISRGQVPLLWSIENNDDQLFTLLLEHGASANVTEDCAGNPQRNYPALMIAALRTPANHRFVEILVDNGADVNVRVTSQGQNATVLQAIMQRWGYTSQLQRDPNDIMSDLMNAELLIEKGADITVRDQLERTLLMLAMEYSPVAGMDHKHTAVVRLLLKGKGASLVNAKNTTGDTALVYALRSLQRAHIVDILMTHGADPSITNNGNTDAYDVAKGMDHLMFVNSYLHTSRTNWTMKQRLVKSTIALVVFIAAFTLALMAYIFPKRFPRWSLLLICVVAVIAFVLYVVMQVTSWQTLSESH